MVQRGSLLEGGRCFFINNEFIGGIMNMAVLTHFLRHLMKNREEIIKEREKDRLKRLIRVMFSSKEYPLEWTYGQTSYTDGKTLYIKHDIQTPHHREFTKAEQATLRKAHGLHERGHCEYDYIPAYADWKREHRTTLKSEWESNLKYPLSWLEFFGNMSLDGRMERLVMLDHPSTVPYLNFSNYEWRFGVRGEQAGESKLWDFRECFASRVLGMTDVEEWDKEAVELVNSVQSKIRQARGEETTFSCLNVVTSIIREVWPTLLEWMDDADETAEDFQARIFIDSHEEGETEWGKQEEVEENVKRVLARIKKEGSTPSNSSQSGEKPEEVAEEQSSTEGELDEEKQANPLEEDSFITAGHKQNNSSEQDEESAPDEGYSCAVQQEEKNLSKDEKELDEQLGDYQKREVEVEIDPSKRLERTRYSEMVVVEPYRDDNLQRYKEAYQIVKRYINPTARTLQDLLAPQADAVRKNQRRGKVMTNRIWRAESLGETTVFERRTKGIPAKDARFLLNWDISGSTYEPYGNHRIVDEMRQAAILLTEACERIKLPAAVYGYTEYSHTTQHIFKPFGRFTDLERATIGGVEPESGNRDTLSLQWAINQMEQYDEDIRLIVMMSDGLPVFNRNEDKDTMRDLVLQAEKKGIDVLCLFVGSPRLASEVHYMYPGRAIVVSNNLSRELSRQVKRIIRKRRG